jgi:hypothetical protein
VSLKPRFCPCHSAQVLSVSLSPGCDQCHSAQVLSVSLSPGCDQCHSAQVLSVSLSPGCDQDYKIFFHSCYFASPYSKLAKCLEFSWRLLLCRVTVQLHCGDWRRGGNCSQIMSWDLWTALISLNWYEYWGSNVLDWVMTWVNFYTVWIHFLYNR